MKLKYYLRGLGIGIICTAIIMGIALSGNKKETMTDTEIIERARLLGMVMPGDTEELPETEEGQESPDDNLARPQEVQSEESGSHIDGSKMEDGSVDKQESDSGTKSGQEDKETADDKAEQPNQDDSAAQQGASPKMIRIEIAAGEFSAAVSQKLYQAGLVSDAEEFNKYLTQKGADQTLRVGVYEIPEGATQDQIIDILQNKE